MHMTLELDPRATALVLIDLQRGIVGRETAPHAAADVVARCASLARACRGRGALVVRVRVAFDASLRDRLASPVDAPMPATPPPADWADLVPELDGGPDDGPGDIVVTKRQWGAFYGTDLDLQLRRRGIGTILIGGIATNFGVESTARDAWERAYHVVFVEDAMASFSADAHRFPVENVFPRLGRVRSTAEVLGALERAERV
jgi:nicotinamidase-related amidase